MRDLIRNWSVLMILTLTITGCKTKTPVEKVYVGTHEFTGNMVADTIIYNVVVKNPDLNDQWTSHCLKGTHRMALIDSVFAMLYNNRITAYDYDTGDKLTPKEVQKRENKEFKRKDIGQIQFAERWFFDSKSSTMQKQVIYMILGYEWFNSDGSLIGYKPVFKVVLRSPAKDVN